MTVRLNPYLGFRDTARAAMDFYQSVFGGELTRMTFADLGMAEQPSERDKVVHSMLQTPHGLVLMAADTPERVPYNPGDNYSVSLSGDDEPFLRQCWDRLVEGGEQITPLDTAPWGDVFGMCKDRFGVTWLVNIGS